MTALIKNQNFGIEVELTGITEETLQKEGVSFGEAMEQLKKYVGLSFKKSSFINLKFLFYKCF